MNAGLRWALPALALAGLGFAVYYTTVLTKAAPTPPNQLALPPESRFAAAISGSGLIESSSREIAIGAFLPGVVVSVPVVEGEWVRRGDPLFRLDARAAEADLAVAERELESVRRRVAEFEAEVADREDQLRRVERLKTGEVVTEDRRLRLFFAARLARAQLASAAIAVEEARARVAAAGVALDRLTVRAPIDGRILKVDVRPGEYVEATKADPPPVLMADDQILYVRAQIDENDLWRFSPDAAAEAMVRGDPATRYALTFARVEPYVLPKRSLTGDATERIDTRVLEVIYRLDPKPARLYVGQQVDVFIEGVPRRAAAPAPSK